MQAKDETQAVYAVARRTKSQKRSDDDKIIDKALAILAARLRVPGAALCSPDAVTAYLKLQPAELEHEAFGVVFLDSQHGAIETEIMFRGSVSQTSVYPREVVKRALQLNAGALILFHNHPSQTPEPSRADEHLTSTLRTALAMVDVRVLDHIIVGGMRTVSMAERGLI